MKCVSKTKIIERCTYADIQTTQRHSIVIEVLHTYKFFVLFVSKGVWCIIVVLLRDQYGCSRGRMMFVTCMHSCTIRNLQSKFWNLRFSSANSLIQFISWVSVYAHVCPFPSAPHFVQDIWYSPLVIMMKWFRFSSYWCTLLSSIIIHEKCSLSLNYY